MKIGYYKRRKRISKKKQLKKKYVNRKVRGWKYILFFSLFYKINTSPKNYEDVSEYIFSNDIFPSMSGWDSEPKYINLDLMNPRRNKTNSIKNKLSRQEIRISKDVYYDFQDSELILNYRIFFTLKKNSYNGTF